MQAIGAHAGRNAGRIALWCLVGIVMAYLLFPVLVVVLISFSVNSYLSFPPPGYSLRWYQQIFSSPEWMNSFWVTLRVGMLTSVLSVAVGVPAAFALVRRSFFGKAPIGMLLMSALIAPPIIKAISVYLLYVKISLLDSIIGLALAHTITGVPFVVLNVVAGLRGVDRNLERAAQIHGATPLEAIFRVVLPLLVPSIAVGAIFAFLQSAQELLVSIFVLSTIEKPLAVMLWEGVRISVEPSIAAASTALIAFVLLLFMTSTLVRGRRKSA